MPGKVKPTVVLAVLLQIILRPCKCLCYKSYKRLFAFTLISAIIIFLLNTVPRKQEYPYVTAPPDDIAEMIPKLHKVVPETVPEVSDFEVGLQRIPARFVQLSKCPSCLGWDLCNAIEGETLRINIPQTPTNMSRNGMYFGLKGNALVLVKVYADDAQFKKYDEHICRDAVGRPDCTVAKDILQSFVVKDETYLPRNIKKAYAIVHTQPEDLANVICVTESMLDNFIEAIDPGPGDVGPDDRALLYTSTIVHPEVVNFRFLSRTEVAWAFPHFVGACGRLIVLDHYGKPLLSLINEPWDTRADLALQILHIIDAFIKGDEAWFIMYHGFEFDNFHVTDDYRVVVVNAHDIGFVDRDAAGEADPADDGQACNQECFEKYLHELYDIKMPLQELTCNKATSIMSNYMYSLACRDILSDLPEHKHTTDRPPGKKHPGKGLLHDIPAAHYDALNEALMECVTENSPSARHQAVEELLEILNHYSADAKQLDFVLPGKRKQQVTNNPNLHKITL